MIGIDFICGLPMTAAGFDMIQNQVDLLSGKITPIPTKSTATAEDAARLLVNSCLQSGDGMPDVIVVDHDPKFVSAMFRAVVKSMGSSLIVGSAYHKNANAKVERANGALGDVLRSFANPRKDDWDLHLPFAAFAINNSASSMGSHLTPLFIDRGAHPRLPLSPISDSANHETIAGYVSRMNSIEKEVRELLTAATAERKAVLDKSRVETVFTVGDKVMLRTAELLDAADIGKLKDRWTGPFQVLELCSPNAYRLALPKRMKCSPVINVDRLKPFVSRVNTSPSPEPVADPGQEGEMEVEMLVGRRLVRNRTEYLVRWQGFGPADDSWMDAAALGNCLERVAEYEAAAPRRRAALRGRPDSDGTAGVAQPAVVETVLPTPPDREWVAAIAPSGLTVARRRPVPLFNLVGELILFWWPQHGWQQGKVSRGATSKSVSKGFSHVVSYNSATSGIPGKGILEVESLLDPASYGRRWVLLRPQHKRALSKQS